MFHNLQRRLERIKQAAQCRVNDNPYANMSTEQLLEIAREILEEAEAEPWRYDNPESQQFLAGIRKFVM